MAKTMAAGAVLLAAMFAAVFGAPALAYEAYIDDASGIVVSRGEAVRGTSETYESAKKRAIDSARNNLVQMLQRQYIDTDSTTIGDLLALHAEKRPILDRYINTAKVFSESEDNGKVKVSIILEYSGPDGYQTMVAQLQGKEPANTEIAVDTGQPDEQVLNDLRERFPAKTPEQMGEPYRVAMFDFDNRSPYKNVDLGEIITDNLRYMFKKDRRFVFVDLSEAMEALSENDLTLDTLKDSPATKNIKVKGLDGVIIGSIKRYEQQVKKHGIGGTGYLEMEFYIEVDLRILDSKTGRWIFYEGVPVTLTERTFTLKSADDADKFIGMDQPESDRGLAGRAFSTMLGQLDLAIRASFPLEGYVLKVISDKIYVNLTKLDGVKTGDIMTVYRVGDVLTDPVTGQAVDRIRDKICTIKIIDVKDTYSQGQLEDIFGEKPQAGDVVMLK